MFNISNMDHKLDAHMASVSEYTFPDTGDVGDFGETVINIFKSTRKKVGDPDPIFEVAHGVLTHFGCLDAYIR